MQSQVTILMPVYNGAAFLREAVDSILSQTFREFTLLIIDDGSTDDSWNVLGSFNDSRISLVRNPDNLGLIATLNKGISLASTDLIARMDCDDIAKPDRLEKQVVFMDRNANIHILGTWFEIIGTTRIQRPPTATEACRVELLNGTVLGHPTVMFRKSALTSKGLSFNAEAIHAEDYRLWIDSQLAGLNIANLPNVLLSYRMHAGQVSTTQAAIQTLTVDSTRALYWVKAFPVTATGKEKLIKEMLEGSSSDLRVYSEIVRFCNDIIEDNDRSGFMDKKMLARFVHRLLVRRARFVYGTMDAKRFMNGLFDKYFYRNLIG
jgi:glycosyltransferase involved in cell wall biosynthesis